MSINSVTKKISISTIANLFILFVSVFSALIFPRFLNVEDFSYWQIYVFYTGFVTIFGLGWIEGIYLKNGGKRYDSLDKSIYSFQTYGLSIFLIFIFGIVGVLAWFFVLDKKLATIIVLVCVEGIIYNLRTYPIYIFLATDKIKEFSISTVIGRGVFLATSLVLILIKQADLYLFILCDIIGTVCCGIYAYVKCRDKILGKPCIFKQGIIEAKNNISIGFSLMATNMIGIAIIGVIKYSVQIHWSVIMFGEIAFSITCINLFLKFMTSIGMVLFPMLCNYSVEKLKEVYISTTTILEYLIAVCMVLYYPVKIILSIYLPQYVISFEYMGFLLPICLFETKVSLLLNTYYKAMRKEKVLMFVNLMVLGMSIVLTILSTIIFSNIKLVVFSILIVLCIRSVVLENILCRKYLNINKKIIGMFSVIISTCFILSNGVIGGWIGMVVYGIIVVIMFLLGKQKIKGSMRLILRKNNE